MKKQFATIFFSVLSAVLEARSSRRPEPRRRDTLPVIAIIISVLGQVLPAYTVYKSFIEYDPELRVGVRETTFSNLVSVPGSGAIGANLTDDVLLLNDGNRPLYIDSVAGSFTKLTLGARRAVASSRNLAGERSVLLLPLRNVTTPMVVNEGASHPATGIILKPGEFRKISWNYWIAFNEGHDKLESGAVYAWILTLGYLDARGNLKFGRMVGSIITFIGKDAKHPSVSDFITTSSSSMYKVSK